MLKVVSTKQELESEEEEKKKREREEALCFLRLYFYLQSGSQQRGIGKLKRLAAPAPLPPLTSSPPPPLLPGPLKYDPVRGGNIGQHHRSSGNISSVLHTPPSTPHICLTSRFLSLIYIVTVKAVVTLQNDQFDMSSLSRTHIHMEFKTRHRSGFRADFQL